MYYPVNCHKCGKFVGKDGNYDVVSDSLEMGYPICGQCLRKKTKEKINKLNKKTKDNNIQFD